MSAIIDEIFDLFARYGAGRYGEDLSLEQHMLQSAAMAEAMAAPRKLVAAALLHDVGHFLHTGGEASAYGARDFKHETLGAVWLSRGFGDEVTAPIALHVQAKRYLCAVEPGYLERLSIASRHSLGLQGGVMTPADAAAFAAAPDCAAAVLLRRCDDRGKDAGLPARTVEGYRGLLTDCLRRPA